MSTQLFKTALLNSADRALLSRDFSQMSIGSVTIKLGTLKLEAPTFMDRSLDGVIVPIPHLIGDTAKLSLLYELASPIPLIAKIDCTTPPPLEMLLSVLAAHGIRYILLVGADLTSLVESQKINEKRRLGLKFLFLSESSRDEEFFLLEAQGAKIVLLQDDPV